MPLPVFPTKKLLDWFAANQRPLPWRQTYNPYHVWISEIMAQQTRIEQMLPYYLHFLKKFPTVQALADADEQSILKSWQGLGYYSRARNLHSAAKQVMKTHNGKIPQTKKELQELKGFGPYISSAVASIAFNESVPVVDGNVLRVGARFLERKEDISLPSTRKKIESKLQEILPHGKAREFNQAWMELGAAICVPVNPLCSECPLNSHCKAFEHGTQNNFPVKSKKGKPPTKHFAMIRVARGDKVWLVRRTSNLLHGMWEFPSVEFFPLKESAADIERAFEKTYGVEIKLLQKKGEFSHQYSHFTQIAHLFDAEGKKSEKLNGFISRNEMEKKPLSKIQIKVLDSLST